VTRGSRARKERLSLTNRPPVSQHYGHDLMDVERKRPSS
jgi:hypothetical protein